MLIGLDLVSTVKPLASPGGRLTLIPVANLELLKIMWTEQMYYQLVCLAGGSEIGFQNNFSCSGKLLLLTYTLMTIGWWWQMIIRWWIVSLMLNILRFQDRGDEYAFGVLHIECVITKLFSSYTCFNAFRKRKTNLTAVHFTNDNRLPVGKVK